MTAARVNWAKLKNTPTKVMKEVLFNFHSVAKSEGKYDPSIVVVVFAVVVVEVVAANTDL